ncbi:meiotic recombination protein REC8 homolog, partial [Saccostrea cucullata]|uniref:meiotic recombination protein REC8 homolog n=1 Tax=Saccostrea cuccullata TaxID=36930 RepID=UPI002ED3D8EC
FSEDIVDYIMVRKQPSVPGRSRPRFSLYLSAKLMFGCVRLYKKQTQYLLEDITSFMVKVRLAANIAENIDLNIACRPDHVTMQDIVELTTEKQPFYDPYFGKIADFHEDFEYVQKLLTELSSPGSDSSMERLRRRRGSEASSSIQVESEHSFLKSALGSPHTVSSLDQITLKEIDMPILPQIAEQTELPPLDEQNIQALLNESARMDTLHHVDTSLQPDVAIPVGESSVKASEAFISLSPQKTTKDAKELEEQIMSPKEKTPRVLTEEPLPEAPPAVRELRPRSQPEVTLMPPPEEEPHRSTRKRRMDLSLELAPLPPSPRTVKRRRRHLIVDENIMVPKTEMKKNLQTGSELSKPFSVPVIGRSDCATLFNQPGSKCLRLSPLIDLWRRNLRPGVLETESDVETPFWTVPSISRDESTRSKRSRRALLPEPEEERRAVQPEISDVQMSEIQLPQPEIPIQLDRASPEKVRADISMGNEMPSMEIPRDASISLERSLQDTTPIQLHLSARSKDDSLSDRSTASRKKRSRSRGSIEEELLVPPSEHSVSDTFSRISRNLSVVQEESEIPMVDTPLPVISKLSQVESRVLRLINSNTSEKDYTTFEEVCPPHFYDRRLAASMFNALLHLCAKGNVYVDQREPYGEMLIQRGHNF